MSDGGAGTTAPTTPARLQICQWGRRGTRGSCQPLLPTHCTGWAQACGHRPPFGQLPLLRRPDAGRKRGPCRQGGSGAVGLSKQQCCPGPPSTGFSHLAGSRPWLASSLWGPGYFDSLVTTQPGAEDHSSSPWAAALSTPPPPHQQPGTCPQGVGGGTSPSLVTRCTTAGGRRLRLAWVTMPEPRGCRREVWRSPE